MSTVTPRGSLATSRFPPARRATGRRPTASQGPAPTRRDSRAARGPGSASQSQPVEAQGLRLDREDFHAAEAGLPGVTPERGEAHHGPGGGGAGVTHGPRQARHDAPAVVVALEGGGGGAELVLGPFLGAEDRALPPRPTPCRPQ